MIHTNRKMMRKITPFLISVVIMLFSAVCFFFSDELGQGEFTVIGLLILSLVTFLLDLVFKKWLKGYKKIVLVESAIIFILIINQYLFFW
jgi:hypothetical protein